VTAIEVGVMRIHAAIRAWLMAKSDQSAPIGKSPLDDIDRRPMIERRNAKVEAQSGTTRE
jgi:hypothetical protein